LTVDCCRNVGASHIVRGIRYVNDFEYEKAIADMNRSLEGHVDTVFLTCLPEFTSVASTLVRDVLRNGGDVSKFLPDVVVKDLAKNH
jgi:pantetheine-phosphate adenylyltransferase